MKGFPGEPLSPALAASSASVCVKRLPPANLEVGGESSASSRELPPLLGRRFRLL